MRSGDIAWKEPTRWRREDLLAALRRRLRGRVREAYVFGSYARGDAEAESDLELILVAETTAPWPGRARAYFDLYRLGLALDVLVYTPAEWAAMERGRHPLFARRREWLAVLLPPR